MGPWLKLTENGMSYRRGRKWIDLSGSYAWDIISALRGPDSGQDYNIVRRLKILTTGRVRGLFMSWDRGHHYHPEWLPGGLHTLEPRVLSAKDNKRLTALLQKADGHFASHWDRAEHVVLVIWHRWPCPSRKRR
jgi:hypothetical protein